MARPPVCKLMDYGKFKYESALKARESRKNQAQTVIKEIKLRPKIDPHDYGTKKGHVERFLKQGDKVKVTIMFRGREQSRPELGFKLLQRLAGDIEELGFVESSPKQDGRNMIMVIGPHKRKADAMAAAKADRASRATARDAASADSAESEAPATESRAKAVQRAAVAAARDQAAADVPETAEPSTPEPSTAGPSTTGPSTAAPTTASARTAPRTATPRTATPRTATPKTAAAEAAAPEAVTSPAASADAAPTTAPAAAAPAQARGDGPAGRHGKAGGSAEAERAARQSGVSKARPGQQWVTQADRAPRHDGRGKAGDVRRERLGP